MQVLLCNLVGFISPHCPARPTWGLLSSVCIIKSALACLAVVSFGVCPVLDLHQRSLRGANCALFHLIALVAALHQWCFTGGDVAFQGHLTVSVDSLVVTPRGAVLLARGGSRPETLLGLQQHTGQLSTALLTRNPALES